MPANSTYRWCVLAITVLFLSLESQSQSSDIQWGGWINADASYFHSESPSIRQPTFQWRINAQPRFTYKGWRVQSLVNIGSFEDRFGQPFNKFGITGGNSWAQFHLGHRTMNFSSLSLSNHLFLGAGVELTPGKFRFAAMYGRFNRQVDADSTDFTIRPAFKRLGYGIKIGAGRPNNFVDVHIFRAIDDTTSMNYDPDYAGVAPEQNFVGGITLRQRFAHRIYVELDAAASAFSRDIRSLNVVSDKPFFGEDFAYTVFQPHTSSQFLGAINGLIDYRHKDFAAGFGYTLIEPDYQTMGSYFFQNDIERYDVHARWRMLDRKLSGNANIGLEHNNLKGNKTTDNNRETYALGFRYQPGRELMLAVNYNGFHTKQDRRDTNLVTSTVLNQFTHSASVLSTVAIKEGDLTTSINVVSRNNLISGDSDFGSSNVRVSYRFGFGEYKITPMVGYGRYAFNGDNLSERYSTGGSATRNWKNLSTSAGLTYILSAFNGDVSNHTIRTNGRLSYMVNKSHRFSLRVMHAYTSIQNASGINEVRVDFGYSFSL
jgi:hypothetical protein